MILYNVPDSNVIIIYRTLNAAVIINLNVRTLFLTEKHSDLFQVNAEWVGWGIKPGDRDFSVATLMIFWVLSYSPHLPGPLFPYFGDPLSRLLQIYIYS